MTLQFGLLVPQGWTMDLAGITDPVEAYETMTRVAQTAEEVGFASAWLVDHFHTIPHPSQEMTFECWMSTAALARDTSTIRIGQMVTCNSYRHPALLAKMRRVCRSWCCVLLMGPIWRLFAASPGSSSRREGNRSGNEQSAANQLSRRTE
jgi:hypothetical protein